MVATPFKDEIFLTDTGHYAEFLLHAEFLLKQTSVSKSDLHETISDGSTEHFSQLEFHIILERRPSYYIMSMIVPVVLNSYLMVIVFVLPVDSGEKVGFSLTVFLAVAVMLTMILDQMPSTALYVSILCKLFTTMFLLSNLVLNVVEVFLTVVVIMTHHRSTEVPDIVDSMTRCIAKVSCWNGCKAAKGSYKLEQTDEPDLQENDIGRKVKVAFKEKVIPEAKYKYSWADVSMILDWFLFTYSFALTTAMTLVYMMALSIGGTINA
ncbi:hypothetical protein KUTeg_003227 [Tegillarca granosa]|uniref:Neurotransmitter-gated ion-channel transmembrane domain-containing protein n=1 Tax=Tegillarca granosa TaxID=220873 RepID=A0ABQ9FN52_TEGGR|nr:hypothetical protein KUTeg_003227 [Tegillarca granosa]